jgi:hypothetical protein
MLRLEAKMCLSAAGADRHEAILLERAKAVANVILGNDPAEWHPVNDWNESGSADVSIAEWCGIDETDPVMRIAGAFLTMIEALHDLDGYSQEDGVPPEQWQWQVDALIDRYAMMFCGISPQVQAML